MDQFKCMRMEMDESYIRFLIYESILHEMCAGFTRALIDDVDVDDDEKDEEKYKNGLLSTIIE